MAEHPESKRSRRLFNLSLRWKLALSYALITTLSLVLAEILVYTSIILLFSSHGIQNAIARQVQHSVLPEIRPYLEQEPVNKQGIQAVLNDWAQGGVSVGINGFFLEKGGVGLGAHVYVLDTAGHVVGCLPDCGNVQALHSLLQRYPFDGRSREARLQDKALSAYVFSIEDDAARRLGYFVLTFPTLHHLLLKMTNTILQSALLFYPPILFLGLIFGWLVGGRLTRRLLPLRDMVNNWAKGNFAIRVQDDGGDEISEFARQLNWVADELETLIKMREMLAGLEERQRIARELHDSVKQRTFAVSLMLRNIQKTPGIPPDMKTKLESILTQVREIQWELRLSIQQLHPHRLSTFDIYQALRSIQQRWQESARGTTIDVQAERIALPPETVMSLYRIAEEAVSNAVRHSGASHITLGFRRVDGGLELVIRDNGHGFDPDKVTYGLGLHSMEERAGQIGAHFTIHSDASGTTVHVLIPENGEEGG